MRNPPGTNPSGRPRVDSCYMGHAYTPDNTRRTTVRVRGKVYVARKCRKCLRANQHRQRWGDPKWGQGEGNVKKCAPSKDPTKLGPTCLVMTEVLRRGSERGITCEQWVNLSKGTMVPTILYRGKRAETLFILSVCPWCGADILPPSLKRK